MSSNRASSSGGVRNLRAMFENQHQAPASPEPRGRSPADSNLASDTDVDGRPRSKIRASFVSVEPPSTPGKELGATKGTPLNSPTAHRRESFSFDQDRDAEVVQELKKTVSQEKEDRKKSLDIEETIPEQAVEDRDSSRPATEIREQSPASDMVNLGSIMKGSDFPEPEETQPKAQPKEKAAELLEALKPVQEAMQAAAPVKATRAILEKKTSAAEEKPVPVKATSGVVAEKQKPAEEAKSAPAEATPSAVSEKKTQGMEDKAAPVKEKDTPVEEEAAPVEAPTKPKETAAASSSETPPPPAPTEEPAKPTEATPEESEQVASEEPEEAAFEEPEEAVFEEPEEAAPEKLEEAALDNSEAAAPETPEEVAPEESKEIVPEESTEAAPQESKEVPKSKVSAASSANAAAQKSKVNGTSSHASAPGKATAKASNKTPAISTKDAPKAVSSKSSAMPKSPAQPKAPKTPTTPKVAAAAPVPAPAPAASKPKAPAAQPKRASTASAASVAPPAASKSKAPAKDTPAQTSPFRKPRPKSPTRPVRLPSHLTAPTASYAAKHEDGSAPQPLGRKPSTASRPAPHKPAATVKKQPSRVSLPAQTTKRPESRQSLKGPDEGFLARMMRPTASSASKTHEKVNSPPRRTASIKPKTGHEGLAAKGKRKLANGASKGKDVASTNGSDGHHEEENGHTDNDDTVAGHEEPVRESTPQTEKPAAGDLLQTPNFEGETIR